MEQLDFGEEDRYVRLDDKKDPLVKLNAIIPWEMFRSRLRSVWRKPEKQRKSSAGRKPWDEIVMFKTIILCALYNL
ncbi:MAG: IS5/IS1182 family transposase, partial [Candidatus Dadabacteria bacterium]|nr:IS5/IS1182 family transposase [Candidatus Dadabacteria bacterium]